MKRFDSHVFDPKECRAELNEFKRLLDTVLVDSNKVFCVTFDDLYEDMNAQLRLYELS